MIRTALRGVSCLLFFLSLMPASPVLSEPRTLVITDELQLGLAESFMDEGEYYRAITEYKKFLYFFPDSEKCPYALLQIGMAYYSGGECPQAIEAFARVRQLNNAEYFTKAAFYEGVCQDRLKNPTAAAGDFERVVAFDPDATQAEEALVGLSLIALDQQDWRASRRALQRLTNDYPDGRQAAAAREALPMLVEGENRPRKSPVVAGTMSAVLPGSGYAYAGRFRDGLAAFLVNGLFIAGTAVAIDDENYPAAALVGGAGLPFYLGNIYGAANAAEKWNLSIAREVRDELAIRLNFRY